MMSKRRYDVIMTLLLRCVSAGQWSLISSENHGVNKEKKYAPVGYDRSADSMFLVSR